MPARRKLLGLLMIFAALLLIPGVALAAESGAAAEGEAQQESAALRMAIQGGTLCFDTNSGTQIVRPDSGLQTTVAQPGVFTIVPDPGFHFVKAVQNGETLDLGADAIGVVSFEAPEGGGSVFVLCEAEAQAVFEIDGQGEVSIVEGDKNVPVSDGESYALPGETAVTIEVADKPDSSFSGAELNGDALQAEQTTDGWKFTLDTGVDGVVHVEFTPSLTVSSSVDHCTLYVMQDGSWVPLDAGLSTLKGQEEPEFGMKPEEGYVLNEVFVNGSRVEPEETDEGMFAFRAEEAEEGEDIIISAACMSPEESISEVDEHTGIRYTLPGRAEDPESNIRAGSKLAITELTEGERYERASTACEQYGEVVHAYDIVLEDEDEVYDPKTAVSVSFPLSEDLAEVDDSELSIIRIGEGGSLSRVPFERKEVDGTPYLVGSADHFCTFAVVRSAPERHTGGVTPPMGDETNLSLYVWLSIAAIAVVAIAVWRLIKYRKNK